MPSRALSSDCWPCWVLELLAACGIFRPFTTQRPGFFLAWRHGHCWSERGSSDSDGRLYSRGEPDRETGLHRQSSDRPVFSYLLSPSHAAGHNNLVRLLALLRIGPFKVVLKQQLQACFVNSDRALLPTHNSLQPKDLRGVNTPAAFLMRNARWSLRHATEEGFGGM
jgi:hypothetical protein